MCRAVRQAVPARRLQRKSAAMRSVPTPVARSVSRAPLRRDRHQADLRNSIPVRTDCLRLLLDQIGPIAKDVTDCATILEAIASHDVKDSTSVQREDYDFISALVDDVRG